MKQLLNEIEVGEWLGYKPATVRRWRQKGTGPKFLKLGTAVRYREADVMEWIERQSEGGRSVKCSDDIVFFSIDFRTRQVRIGWADGSADDAPYSEILMHEKIDGQSWLDFLGGNDRMLRGADDPYMETTNAAGTGEGF